jgi:hypothetical protein
LTGPEFLTKVSRWLPQIGCTAMTASAEYRKLLEECLHWADTAPSEQERTSFLQLAKTWYEAGLREEQSLGLVGESKELLERLRNYPGEQTA